MSYIAKKLKKYNLYASPVLDATDSDRERLQTRLLVPTFAVLTVAVVLWYSLTAQTAQMSVLLPSYDQYQGIASYNPVCPCSGQPLIKHTASFSIPPAADFSSASNICFIPKYLAAACSYYSLIQPVCTSPGAQLLTGMYFPAMQVTCASMSSALEGELALALTKPAGGGSLMSPPDLTRSVQAATALAVVSAANQASLAMRALAASIAGLTVSAADLSSGAAATHPPGCSCSGDISAALQGSGLYPLSSGCTFQPSYDAGSAGKARGNYSTCSFPGNLVTFPLSVLTDPSLFFSSYGLDLPSQAIPTSGGQFPLAPIPSSVTSFGQLPDLILDSLYNSSDAGGQDFGLAPGLLSVDYPGYYAACKPQRCDYIVTGPPSFVSALVAALGVLGGAWGVLHTAVGCMGTVAAKGARVRQKKRAAKLPYTSSSSTSSSAAPPGSNVSASIQRVESYGRASVPRTAASHSHPPSAGGEQGGAPSAVAVSISPIPSSSHPNAVVNPVHAQQMQQQQQR